MIRSERRLRAALLLLASTLLPFCGGQTSDSGSSESHFLGDCNATCAAGMSCVCGVCTVVCDTDAACVVHASGATCAPPTCDDGNVPAATCDVTCASKSDCAVLGGGYVCDAGRCRTGGGGGGAMQLTCDERTQQAADAVQQAIEAADPSCTTDADCVAFDNSSDCAYGCGAVLSEAGATAVQSTIDELNGGLCATFEADGCEALRHPCPFAGDPGCFAGTCSPDLRAFGEPCSAACGNQCYVPGPGGAGICSAPCSDDADCGPTGICQASGATGKWCFRRCASDAECQSVNGNTQNPLYCAERLDPESATGYQPLTGTGEGFCIQSSEP